MNKDAEVAADDLREDFVALRGFALAPGRSPRTWP